MMDFVEAVKRPLRTDSMTIILGIIFTIFPFTRPLLHGLGIELARRTQQHNDHMPKFDDFVDLFLSGLIMFVVVILYFLPAILALVIGVSSSFPALLSLSQHFVSAPVLALRNFILLVSQSAAWGALALVFGFLASVMAPIGIQLYARDKRIGSAFQFSRVWKAVSTGHYWVSWVLMMGYAVVLLGIVTLLSIPEFNALSLIFLGIAGYMWWMTWYIMFAEVANDSGIFKVNPHHVEFKRRLGKHHRR